MRLRRREKKLVNDDTKKSVCAISESTIIAAYNFFEFNAQLLEQLARKHFPLDKHTESMPRHIISSLLFIVILLATCFVQSKPSDISFIDAASCPRNRWKVSRTFDERKTGDSIQLGAFFTLYRSYYEPCPPSDLEKELRLFDCGWLKPDRQISCSSDLVGEKGMRMECD